jgi:hypothetical protein
MKTRIHAATEVHRSLVPVALFDYESLEVRVRRAPRHSPVPVGECVQKDAYPSLVPAIRNHFQAD